MTKVEKTFHNFVDFPLVVQIGSIALLLAFILDLIGFAAPYWNVDEATFSGLWQMCTSDGNDTYCGYHDSSLSEVDRIVKEEKKKKGKRNTE
ncbi:hypothetical protein CHS0354_039751 [Potamilus streckersoni]|uniref:Uncharacterized protein n=1 Tax=Potamilus streckersoni TaxID=2493646 RepID=A0AAE0S0I5_9BIVA|nr:hypothetical protein CHS0354_039751 [Potamilus streckersoni]